MLLVKTICNVHIIIRVSVDLICFILFILSLFCLVAPQVALSTVSSVQVANSKRGRRT